MALDRPSSLRQAVSMGGDLTRERAAWAGTYRLLNMTTLSRDAARPYLPICCALFPRHRTARISRQARLARSPSSAVNSSERRGLAVGDFSFQVPRPSRETGVRIYVYRYGRCLRI